MLSQAKKALVFSFGMSAGIVFQGLSILIRTGSMMKQILINLSREAEQINFDTYFYLIAYLSVTFS
jgi:hypothetical protein